MSDGVVERVETYDIHDLTNLNPPWWHVGYQIQLRVATQEHYDIMLIYSIEPYVNLADKPRSYFDDFVLVEQGERVRKGDILAYMYIPSFDAKVGPHASSHIHFLLSPWDRSRRNYVPALFSEDIVEQFGEIYRNPLEGWESTSFGHDWARARGVPTGMGWMIDGDENPFGDDPLDVLMYDGIRDIELDGKAHLDPRELGFLEEDLLFAWEGHGDFVSDPIEFCLLYTSDAADE